MEEASVDSNNESCSSSTEEDREKAQNTDQEDLSKGNSTASECEEDDDCERNSPLAAMSSSPLLDNPMKAEDGYRPSAYELQRLERIRRNHAYLAKLGLDRGGMGSTLTSPSIIPPLQKKQSSKTKKRARMDIDTGDRRKSGRIKDRKIDFNEVRFVRRAHRLPDSATDTSTAPAHIPSKTPEERISDELFVSDRSQFTALEQMKKQRRKAGFVRRELNRVQSERRQALKFAERNLRAAVREQRWADQASNVYRRKLQKKEEARKKDIARRLFASRADLEKLHREKIAVKRRAMEEIQRREAEIKMSLIDALERFPVAVSVAERDLDILLLERIRRGCQKVVVGRGRGKRQRTKRSEAEETERSMTMPMPHSASVNTVRVTESCGEGSTAAAVKNKTNTNRAKDGSIPSSSSSPGLAEAPSPNRRRRTMATMATTVDAVIHNVTAASGIDIAESQKAKMFSTLVPPTRTNPTSSARRASRPRPRRVGGPVSFEFARSLDRSWLDGDSASVDLTASGVAYVPQVGDTVLYYPLGHKIFLEQFPDLRAKKLRLTTRKPPWLRDDWKVLRGEGGDDLIAQGKDPVGMRHGMLCVVEKTHAEFPPEQYHRAVVAGEMPFLKPRGKTRFLPVSLQVTLKPLVPVIPVAAVNSNMSLDEQGVAAKQELAQLQVTKSVAMDQKHSTPPAIFSVVMFPSGLPEFIVPFTWAYLRRNDLCVDDRVKLHIEDGATYVGKVKSIERDCRLDVDPVYRRSVPPADMCYIRNFAFRQHREAGCPLGLLSEEYGPTAGVDDWPTWEGVSVQWDDGSECRVNSWELTKTGERGAVPFPGRRSDTMKDCTSSIAPHEGIVWTLDEATCSAIHSSLWAVSRTHPRAAPFVEPVTQAEAPAYFCAVPLGMCLRKILRRLRPHVHDKGEKQTGHCYYRSMRALTSDVREIFENCLLYNDPCSDIVAFSQELVHAAEQAVVQATTLVGKGRVLKLAPQYNRDWLCGFLPGKSLHLLSAGSNNQSSVLAWVPQVGDHIFYSRKLHEQFVSFHRTSFSSAQCKVPNFMPQCSTPSSAWLSGVVVRLEYVSSPLESGQCTFSEPSSMLALTVNLSPQYMRSMGRSIIVHWRPCHLSQERHMACLCSLTTFTSFIRPAWVDFKNAVNPTQDYLGLNQMLQDRIVRCLGALRRRCIEGVPPDAIDEKSRIALKVSMTLQTTTVKDDHNLDSGNHISSPSFGGRKRATDTLAKVHFISNKKDPKLQARSAHPLLCLNLVHQRIIHGYYRHLGAAIADTKEAFVLYGMSLLGESADKILPLKRQKKKRKNSPEHENAGEVEALKKRLAEVRKLYATGLVCLSDPLTAEKAFGFIDQLHLSEAQEADLKSGNDTHALLSALGPDARLNHRALSKDEPNPTVKIRVILSCDMHTRSREDVCSNQRDTWNNVAGMCVGTESQITGRESLVESNLCSTMNKSRSDGGEASGTQNGTRIEDKEVANPLADAAAESKVNVENVEACPGGGPSEADELADVAAESKVNVENVEAFPGAFPGEADELNSETNAAIDFSRPILFEPKVYEDNIDLARALYGTRNPNRREACAKCISMGWSMLTCRVRKGHSNPDVDPCEVPDPEEMERNKLEARHGEFRCPAVQVRQGASDDVGTSVVSMKTTCPENDGRVRLASECSENYSLISKSSEVTFASNRVPTVTVDKRTFDSQDRADTAVLLPQSREKDFPAENMSQENCLVAEQVPPTENERNEKMLAADSCHVPKCEESQTYSIERISGLEDPDPVKLLGKAKLALELAEKAVRRAKRTLELPLELSDDFINTFPVDKEDGHYMVCTVCGFGGDMLICEGCPCVAHADCYRLEEIPAGDWYCKKCSSASNRGDDDSPIEQDCESKGKDATCEGTDTDGRGSISLEMLLSELRSHRMKGKAVTHKQTTEVEVIARGNENSFARHQSTESHSVSKSSLAEVEYQHATDGKSTSGDGVCSDCVRSERRETGNEADVETQDSCRMKEETSANKKVNVGSKILKHFEGHGHFKGEVIQVATEEIPYFKIRYEDGDEEDMSEDELFQHLVQEPSPDGKRSRVTVNSVKKRCRLRKPGLSSFPTEKGLVCSGEESLRNELMFEDNPQGKPREIDEACDKKQNAKRTRGRPRKKRNDTEKSENVEALFARSPINLSNDDASFDAELV